MAATQHGSLGENKQAQNDHNTSQARCETTVCGTYGIETVYIGSINSSAVRVGEVFKPALRQNAASLIVVHNHPSGDPTPSPEDVAVTRQLVEADKLLGVDVLDHLVIGHGRWISLRERRLGVY